MLATCTSLKPTARGFRRSLHPGFLQRAIAANGGAIHSIGKGAGKVFCLPYWGYEPVADVAYGLDIPRSFHVITQCAPEGCDRNVDPAVKVARGVAWPQCIFNLISGHKPIGVLRKENKNLGRQRWEIDRLPVSEKTRVLGIHFEHELIEANPAIAFSVPPQNTLRLTREWIDTGPLELTEVLSGDPNVDLPETSALIPYLI
jgi:hypothetical protein